MFEAVGHIMKRFPRRFVRVFSRILLLVSLAGFIAFIGVHSDFSPLSSQFRLKFISGGDHKANNERENIQVDKNEIHPVISWEKIKEKLTFTGTSELSAKQIVKKNYIQLGEIMGKPIDLPKVDNLVGPPENAENYERANGTLMILTRNRDAGAVVYTVKQIEEHFNKKFHYPYVFLNEEKFTERFKSRIKNYVSGECYFEQVAPEDWVQPEFIDKNKQNVGMLNLARENVAYARKLSYHNMCRYYSRGFYNHPRMKQFRYYWRFEPGTDYFCDIDYDVFKFMQDNDKTYGFTISIYDIRQSLRTIWPDTLEFVEKHPEYVNPNGAMSWLTNSLQKPENAEETHGYSTCHFWSNFEIADMNFFRSKPYSEWVEYLDKAGGFYYERWGDAPVHTIGLSLFADRKRIHWFRDIGYRHVPYTNCPNSEKCSRCTPGKFTYMNLWSENCLTNWWNLEMDDDQKSLY